MKDAAIRSSLRRKLLHSLSASALGPVVTALLQVIMIPLLLKGWGAQRFGEWVLLSAAPSYLSMTDMGFGSAAANEMTMQVARGERGAAVETFQSTGALVAAVSTLALLSVLLFSATVPINSLLNIHTLSSSKTRIVLLFLSVYSLLNLYGGIIGAGFRCDGNFAESQVFYNVTRLAENVTLIAIVLFGAGLVEASVGFLAMRLAGTLLMAWDLKRRSPWLHYGITHANVRKIRNLSIPALSFMAFPAGNALSIQGTILLIGHLLGPIAATTFSTLRTLTRFALQLTEVIKYGIWPELSVAFGRSDMVVARRLYRRACELSFWLSLIAASSLWIFGRRIFELWTRNRVIFEEHVFDLLLLSVIAASLWSTASVIMLASNSHVRLATFYVSVTTLSLGSGFILTAKFELIGTAISLLAVDGLMCLWILRTSNKAGLENFLDTIRYNLIPK